MTALIVLAYLGGVMTIASPCILPVVPLVLSRTGRPLVRDIFPMLAGMALMFAAVASVATLSAAWLVRASEGGRIVALMLLAVVGVSLLVPRVAAALAALPVRLGTRLDRAASARAPHVVGNGIIGAAIALLWAPCAGPILGLVVALAAAGGPGVRSTTLYLAFAAGAATSLAVVLAASGRVLERIKSAGGVDVWVRRALGGATLAVVLLLASGRDAQVFGRAGTGTAPAEARLVALFHPGDSAASPNVKAPIEPLAPPPLPALAVQGAFPGFAGGGPWINSQALTPESLKGKVVMVDFWTFLCYNCLNALPHVEALAAKYRDSGLVVVGVHTPEFPTEHDEANVRDNVKRLGVVYPVVMDNDYAIWRAFKNEYWPASFIIDRQGKIRYRHFGEGAYDQQDRVVSRLLSESAK
ncbi:MAG TPA: cytochrome c biogenesis protein/redoxin [Gemmatimonadaceae bacterium]|nr:cytochrome c biogenesis protein/redoxin [Gemmatimonadaceae bacterium]